MDKVASRQFPSKIFRENLNERNSFQVHGFRHGVRDGSVGILVGSIPPQGSFDHGFLHQARHSFLVGGGDHNHCHHQQEEDGERLISTTKRATTQGRLVLQRTAPFLF